MLVNVSVLGFMLAARYFSLQVTGIPLKNVCLISLSVRIGVSPGSQFVRALVRRMLDSNCSTVIVGSFLTVLMNRTCSSLSVLVAALAIQALP